MFANFVLSDYLILTAFIGAVVALVFFAVVKIQTLGVVAGVETTIHEADSNLQLQDAIETAAMKYVPLATLLDAQSKLVQAVALAAKFAKTPDEQTAAAELTDLIVKITDGKPNIPVSTFRNVNTSQTALDQPVRADG